jgi:erythromycin esterase
LNISATALSTGRKIFVEDEMLKVMKKIEIYLLVFVLHIVTAGCASKVKESITPAGTSAAITLPPSGITALQSAQDLDVLLHQIGTAQYVLLGEASHGTAEFYSWRAALSQRLIQEKGFNVIAVEGDWPAAYAVNRYIRGEQNASSAAEALQNFQRWPTWMWANQEIAGLTDWLRQYNQDQPTNPVGFYGLDMYSLWESLEAITEFSEADAATLAAVRKAQSCLAPYNQDEQAYAQATTQGASCAGAIGDVLVAVRSRIGQLPAGHEAAFNAEQNALVAVNAERYYRAMTGSGAGSWNIRDRHMMETINRLQAHQGPGAKIIIWEHNTHVGDARHTDMAASGDVNVGQLVREEHAQAGVYIIGFGTYEGTVIASGYWGGPATKMTVPAAPAGSWEALLHQTPPANKLIDLQSWRADNSLTQRRGHRAIGVVYDPDREAGNYVPTDLPNRYDAFIFIDKTQALHPLPVKGAGQKRVAVPVPFGAPANE